MKLSLKIIEKLSAMPLDSAKTRAKDLILDNTNQVKKQVTAWRLRQDIDRARTSSELQRILWMVMLSSEGLSVTNSAWRNHYRSYA